MMKYAVRPGILSCEILASLGLLPCGNNFKDLGGWHIKGDNISTKQCDKVTSPVPG